tara:strand:+ start:590 stop:964 length:375 start_codon:yes stop_codon:yes gene_type:complete
MSNRQRTPKELAFNATVGRNIKYLRKIRNLNQSKVAAALAVTFQQVQKYEKGANGLSSIRLKHLADFFKVGCDVLVDPNMITAHRGFTGDMDWLEHQVEIDEELKRKEYRAEFVKENTDVNNKA